MDIHELVSVETIRGKEYIAVGKMQNCIDDLCGDMDKKESECKRLHNKLMETEKSMKTMIEEKDCRVSEMQSHIDRLNVELEEALSNKLQLPKEPIKVADMLIHATGTCETGPLMRAINKQEQCSYNIYKTSDLRQIAEHLLIYCNNAED